MLITYGRQITITKGDSGTLYINCKSSIPPNGTIYKFTVKKEPIIAAEALITKTVSVQNGIITLVFIPSDTSSLNADTYYWDLRHVDGTQVYTPFSPQTFVIKEAVGNV